MPETGLPPTLERLAVPIETLRPYSANPRHGDLEAIKASLRYHGQYRPIVVRQGTHEILAGNHTFLAAKELGWDQIAVTEVECDDDEAARIVLVDNRLNDRAQYDREQLVDLLHALPGLDGTGWDDDALGDLIGKASEAETAAQLAGLEYKVVVDCANEAEQAALIERLEGEGLTVRALIA